MSENKTGKYLKYAIGEIVLVMVGILLALQVNNWNENRKSRIEEQKLIANINQEFIINLAQLDSSIIKINSEMGSLSILLQTMSNVSKHQFLGERLDSLLGRASGFPKWKRSNLNIKKIESSSHFGKFTTNEMKNLIYDWLSKYESVERIEENGESSYLSFINYIKVNGSWREIDKYGWEDIGPSILMPDNNHLLLDYQFENVVDENLVWLRHRVNEYIKIREHMLKIIDATRAD